MTTKTIKTVIHFVLAAGMAAFFIPATKVSGQAPRGPVTLLSGATTSVTDGYEVAPYGVHRLQFVAGFSGSSTNLTNLVWYVQGATNRYLADVTTWDKVLTNVMDQKYSITNRMWTNTTYKWIRLWITNLTTVEAGLDIGTNSATYWGEMYRTNTGTATTMNQSVVLVNSSGVEVFTDANPGRMYFTQAPQSGIAATNWTPTTCCVTSTPPANTVTNLASGIAGNTNVVTLPNVVNGALVTAITFNCNTNTPYSFDLLFASSPLTWPAMSSTNNSAPAPDATWGTNIVATWTFTTYATNAWGNRTIVTFPVNLNLPGTFYVYKKYNSAITNAGGGATNLFTFHYQHPGK